MARGKKCPNCGRYRARETGWFTKKLKCDYCSAVTTLERKPVKKGRIFRQTIGYTETYQTKGGDQWRKQWAQARQKALERARHRCQRCGSQERLEVHHKKPVKHKGDDRLSNLMVLCRDCHKRAHREKKGLFGWLTG